MNSFHKHLVTLTIGSFIGIGVFSYIVAPKNAQFNALEEKTVQLTESLKTIQNKEQQRSEIKQYTLKTMELAKSKLDNFKRELYAEKITSAAVKYFNTKEKQEAFVILLSIESKFDPKAKSGANAYGMGQIVSQWATEHAKTCGLEAKSITTEDLYDVDINLQVAACHFNYLIDEITKEGGDVKQALAGYNSGKSSITTKKVGMLKDINQEVCDTVKINQETCGYIISFKKIKKELASN